MSIRTQEELVDHLDKDLAWRKKELSIIQTLCLKCERPDDRQRCLIRSGVMMLYAHWEGYVQSAASAYLEYIAKRRLHYKDLASSLVAFELRKKLERSSAISNPNNLLETVDLLMNRAEQRSNIPFRDGVETRSNLSFNVFVDILLYLNLASDIYKEKEDIVNEGLVKARNSIAHGKSTYIELELFENTTNEVINIMTLFKNDIINSATRRLYRSDVEEAEAS